MTPGPTTICELVDCMITNAVRCAPPLNKPLPVEEATCRPFLKARLAALPRLKVIVTLGDVSRRSVLKTLGLPGTAIPPGHGVEGEAAGYHPDQQLPLLPAEHEHGTADAGDVRGDFRAGEGDDRGLIGKGPAELPAVAGRWVL